MPILKLENFIKIYRKKLLTFFLLTRAFFCDILLKKQENTQGDTVMHVILDENSIKHTPYISSSYTPPRHLHSHSFFELSFCVSGHSTNIINGFPVSFQIVSFLWNSFLFRFRNSFPPSFPFLHSEEIPGHFSLCVLDCHFSL